MITAIKVRTVLGESGAIDVAKTLEALRVLLEKKNSYLDKREGVTETEDAPFEPCADMQARISSAMSTILANHARRAFRLDWLVPTLGAMLFDYSETCEQNIIHFFQNNGAFRFDAAMVVADSSNQACVWDKVA